MKRRKLKKNVNMSVMIVRYITQTQFLKGNSKSLLSTYHINFEIYRYCRFEKEEEEIIIKYNDIICFGESSQPFIDS
jgi:hypothetical protein